MLVEDVITIICEVRSELNASELSRDTQLDILGLGSLELTEVILEIEERYEVEIDIGAFDATDSFKTIGDIVDRLEKTLNGKSQSPN